MVVRKFEDLIAWQKAQDLAVNVYAVFEKCRDFSFKDQICRATVSISNNIAEGFDRSSDADFVRFLYIAAASASEMRSMCYLAERLKHTTTEEKLQLVEYSNEVSKIIRGLIKSIKKD